METGFKVNIGADDAGLRKGLASAESSITNFAKTVKKGSNEAGFALQNLSRVAQDVPFGFVGIQNNLNPLLESFSRLKKETGSTGGALKALASSLTGAAGLGLGLSLVTAAVSFATIGFGAWSRMLGGAGEETRKVKDETKSFKEELDKVKSSAIATGIKLQTFVDTAKNGQLPLQQRNYALAEANKILGEHGEKLTLASVGTAAATEQIKLYTDAIINQAIANKSADRIAELYINQAKAIEDVRKATENYLKARERANKKSVGPNFGNSGALLDLLDFQKAAGVLTDKESALSVINSDLTDSIELLKTASAKASEFFGKLGTKAGITKGTAIPNKVSKVTDIKSFVPQEIESKQVDLTIGVVGLEKLKEIPKANDAINLSLATTKERLTEIGTLVGQTLFQGFQNLFQTIIDGGGNALKSFLNVIKQLIVKLIAAAVAAFVLSTILSGIGGGTAFGKAGLLGAKGAFGFKGLFSSFTGLKLAKGGMSQGVTNAMIGDNPSGKEAVIPFERMGEFLNMAGGGGSEVRFRIEGRDLVGIQKKFDQSNGRTS